MRDALDTAYEIVNLSPRRDATLHKIKQEMPEGSPGIRVFCPTRRTVRAEALRSIISNYEFLQKLWVESLDFVKETEMKCHIQGVASCMKTFNFSFGTVLGELLLRHSDNLSRMLQSSNMSAAGQKIAMMTVATLQSIRSDDNFDLFWKRITKMAEEKEIDEPVLPRRRKLPRRYDGSHVGDFPDTVENHYRRLYFEALDPVICGIKDRFDQLGYKIYCNL